jgi:hypothetical protein
MCILVNSFIFIDLYLTIKNPFFPRSKRCRWYATTTFLFCLVFTFILIESISELGTGTTLYGESQKEVNTVFKYFTVILVLITFVAFILVLNRLVKKGTSADLRKKVCRRHVVNFLLFLSIILRVFFMQWGISEQIYN